MVAKLILPLLSLSVFYTIFYFSQINGAIDLVNNVIASKTLPGDVPLRTVYTGVEPLDRLLTVLTTFFWPTADGSNPSLFMHSIGFSGTFGSAWMLVILESWRRGNAWTIVAFPMVFGLLAQTMTFAFATPLYCTIQLFSSVTAVKPTPENIRVPRAILKAIPLAFVVGYVVPTGLLVAPISDRITPDLKQIFIALWQPWPAYVSILLTVANALFSPFTINDRTIEGGRATLRSLRFVYGVAFVHTAIPHIISWGIPLATVVAPTLFQERFLGPLHPSVVFNIPQPWEAPVAPVESIGAGVHTFLRWDYLTGAAGVLVWAVSLYQTAHRAVYGRVECFGLLTKVTVLSVLAGPVGAAVELMWERDELIVNEMGGLKRVVSAVKKTG